MRFLAKSTQKVKHNDYAEADASDESDGDTSSDDSDNGRSECDDPENIDLIEGDQKRNWTQLEGVRSYYAWRWARDDDNAGYLDENGVPRFTVSMCKNVFVAKPIWDKHVCTVAARQASKCGDQMMEIGQRLETQIRVTSWKRVWNIEYERRALHT